MQDLLALRAKLAEAGVPDALGYSKTPLRSSRRKRKRNISALAEEAWSAYTKGVAVVGREGQQVGARPVRTSRVNAFKSTVAATTAAFDQFQKATKQVVSLADASVRAATANASNAAKATTKGRKAA